jgi:hypothetical protein
MKANREILKEILKNPKNKHLLIAEVHTDHSSKDLILQNMDLLATSGRHIIIILEHVSIKQNELLNSIGHILKGELEPAHEAMIDELIKREFSNMYTLFTPGGKKLLDVIKQGLKNGFIVAGAENHITGYTSVIRGNYCNRIYDGNRAFAIEIKNHQQLTLTDPFIILLAGANHIADYKAEGILGTPVIKGVKSLIAQNDDTVSWLVKDCEENEMESIGYNQVVNVTKGGAPQYFDIFTNRLPVSEIELPKQETFEATDKSICFFSHKHALSKTIEETIDSSWEQLDSKKK